MALKSITTEELQKELARRERGAAKLQAKRERLLKQLEALDKELASLGLEPGERPRRRTSTRGGGRAGGTRRRARNPISLPDAIAAAMEVRAVVTPAEAAQLVKSNGYKTNAKNFNMMVSNALAKDKRFKRLARGQYERIA